MTTTSLNIKGIKIPNKIPNITHLVTKTARNTKVTEMENKIPDTSTLVRKTEYNTKINEIENKILDISDFDTKLRGVNSKITSNKTRTVSTETN